MNNIVLSWLLEMDFLFECESIDVNETLQAKIKRV